MGVFSMTKMRDNSELDTIEIHNNIKLVIITNFFLKCIDTFTNFANFSKSLMHGFFQNHISALLSFIKLVNLMMMLTDVALW